MTLESMSQFLSSVAGCVGESAVRSIAVAAAAGFVLSVARVGHARLRLVTWTGVLYTSMMIPLLGIALPAIDVRVLPPIHVQPLPSITAAVLPPNDATQAASMITAATPSDAPASEPARGAATGGTRTLSGGGDSGFRVSATFSNETLGRGVAAGFQSGSTSVAATGGQLGWWSLVAVVYLLVAAIMLARVITGLMLGRRLRRQALEITDSAVMLLIDQLSNPRVYFGRGRSARVRVAESSSVSVPLAAGALNPMILLPPGWREWDLRKLSAVLAHELSHVARRDPLTQLVSAIHRSIFWFSPLAWWLHRHLMDLAEQASDDSALQAVRDPAFYAEVLLGFFRLLNAAPARWQGVSIARGARAERRIDRMLSSAAPSTAQVTSRAIAAIAVLAIGLAIPAASLRIGRASVGQQEAPASRAAKSPASPAAPLAALTGSGPVTQVPPLAVLAGSEPTAQAPPLAVLAGSGPTAQAPPLAVLAGSGPGAHVPLAVVAPGSPLMALAGAPPTVAGSRPFAAIAPLASLVAAQAGVPQDREVGTDDGWEGFAIVKGNGSSYITGNWSGDGERIKALRSAIKGDFIWFKREGRGYLITDPETIKAAESFFAPQEELGRQQAELGRQQAALGEKQADLGRQQAAVAVEMPDLTAEIRKLADRMKGVKTQEELSELQAELSGLQARLSATQSQASEEQSRLSQVQSGLGHQQSELGRQQSQLGREQSRLAREANRKIRQLLERALRDGLAQPEPASNK